MNHTSSALQDLSVKQMLAAVSEGIVAVMEPIEVSKEHSAAYVRRHMIKSFSLSDVTVVYSSHYGLKYTKRKVQATVYFNNGEIEKQGWFSSGRLASIWAKAQIANEDVVVTSFTPSKPAKRVIIKQVIPNA